jgi:hypothetical protein
MTNPTSTSRNFGAVLNDIEQDLDNAEWPGLLGLALHTLRDSVWLPSIRLVRELTPTLPKPIDQMAVLLADTSRHVLKWTYSILPHSPSLSEDAAQAMQLNSIQLLDSMPQSQDISDNLSLLISSAGMFTNLFLDLTTNSLPKFNSFLNTSKMFLAFLMHTGVDQELTRAFLNPNAGISMFLMIKTHMFLNDDRQVAASFENEPVNEEDKLKLLKESKRCLQFAVASYGAIQTSASNSARAPRTTSLVPVDQSLIQLQQILGEIFQNLRKRRMAKYLRIPENQILYLTPPGGDFMIVGHMVAIDHATQSIVLAIRGTYSVSDIFTDIDATAGKCWESK